MEERAGSWVALVRCPECEDVTYSAVAVKRPDLVSSCARCGSERVIADLIEDRRSGEDRRGAIQRNWDPESRSWQERREQRP